MIRIVVVTHQGVPVARSLATQFGPGGGTIGRAPTNALVLDDPERTVSRVHAQVVCREGHYFVVDRGSNPMLCNGRPLGAGNEVALNSGDRLVLGGFELRVEAEAEAPMAPAAGGPGFGDDLGLGFGAAAAAPATDDDPFADLLAGLGAAPAASAPAPVAAGRPADPMLFPNPLESGAGRSAQPATDDPFADLLGPAAGPAAAPRGSAALDDFSDLGIPSAGKATSIDDLFGGSAGMGGLGGDPLALSPLADPLLQPNTAAHADPLAALQGTPRASAAPRSDHLPVGQFGYVPPLAVTPPAPPPAAVAFDDETGLPIGKASPPPPAFAPSLAPAPAPAPATPAAASAASTPSASDAELLAALLRGLGSQHQPPAALTPGLMERIGVILRGSTEGTLQLLLTRQEFKREVRAEVTMIASQANNPLKFSPTVEVALAHLLGPGVRGFMPPEAAMRDAYNDLRAHQFGVMVGMRAALAHVIERFAPDELEKKIAAKSALDSLFAANRKARLWDQFVALYGGIATEAEDDFHSLFGKAFLEAYEAQMERLKSGQ